MQTTTYLAAEFTDFGGDLNLVQKEVQEPPALHVRLRVHACGVCHSDLFTKECTMGNDYPRVPGHEVAGVIEKLGDGLDKSDWKVGMRVGVGWHGGHCGFCLPCRRGDFILCKTELITGITHDGGYAEYAIIPAEALVHLPDSLSFQEAAPLLCAGLTTFNSLRRSGALAGDLVAVQGIGALGHLGIQYAKKAGYKTVAISNGKDKEELAKKLGADEYIDASVSKFNASNKLYAMGGAKIILATAPSSEAISSLIEGLGVDSKLYVLGISMEAINVTPTQLISRRASIVGWPSGVATDAEDTLNFSALNGVRAMTEVYPLEDAQKAFEHAMANKARFKVVLDCSPDRKKN